MLGKVVTLCCAGVMMSQIAVADEAKNSKRLDKLLSKYEQTSETKKCLSIARIHDTEVLDNQHIVFHMRGGESYLNHLPNRCPRLGVERAFGYKTSTSELCHVDIITVLESGVSGVDTGASCGLGHFTLLKEKAVAE